MTDITNPVVPTSPETQDTNLWDIFWVDTSVPTTNMVQTTPTQQTTSPVSTTATSPVINNNSQVVSPTPVIQEVVTTTQPMWVSSTTITPPNAPVTVQTTTITVPSVISTPQTQIITNESIPNTIIQPVSDLVRQEVVTTTESQAVINSEPQVESVQPQTIPNPVVSPVMTTPIIQQTIPVIAPVVTIPATTNTVQIPTVVQPPITTTVATVQSAPSITVKKWSKVSPIAFFIGCGLFGFLIIGIISVTLYFAIQNPSKFQWIIGIEGIKSGLKLFTGLFFWILFLWWFVGSIFNLYKMITTKVGSKIKYVVGIILSLMLLSWSVFWGITSFNKINEIIWTTGDQNSLLVPAIQFKDKERPISEWYPIIAPTKINYSVNSILLDRFITTNFPNKIVNTLTLDCGNETQKLAYNPSSERFDGSCLYMKKWEYTISLISNTTDSSTQVTADEVTVLWPLSVVSEISFAPSSGEPLQFNDAKDEIIIGKAPTKLEFQADKIFSDLKLDQYNIQRDLDGDGVFDKRNVTTTSRQFRTPQVQKIYYTLPDLGVYKDLVYEFDFRVLQNDVPICTITTAPSDKTNMYTITSTFDTNEPAITSYLYKIKNLATNKFITAPTNKQENFDYEFPIKGAYVVYLEYLTEDGKPWKCESDTIDVWSSDFTINYTTQYKWPNDTKWQNFVGQTSGAQVILNTNGITTRVLPARIQITLNSISPQSTSLQKEVRLDNQLIQSPDGKTYEITLQNATHEEITITVSDSKTKATSTVSLPITIIQKDIIWELKIFPDSVGVSPFEVTLDASTTTITDKDDEIIYFSWDFGDGKKVANSSQARTAHTYLYDEANQNGSYTPSVVITTKKGKKATFSVTSPILVKKPNLISKIVVDSHPAQIATVGEKVEFSLQTDGNPNHISWDFGTQEGIECDDRSCANVPMFFNVPGTYSIKATTTYKDLTTSIATTKVIIQEK